jgi:hypothetical protein
MHTYIHAYIHTYIHGSRPAAGQHQLLARGTTPTRRRRGDLPATRLLRGQERFPNGMYVVTVKQLAPDLKRVVARRSEKGCCKAFLKGSLQGGLKRVVARRCEKGRLDRGYSRPLLCHGDPSAVEL